MGQSSQGTAPSGPLTVSVEVDQRTFAKKLTFNRNVTTGEASIYLWGSPGRESLLKPEGSSIGKHQIFMLDTRDAETLMSLRREVRDAILQGSVIRSNAKPYDFPQWVPENVRNDIRSQKLPRGVRRYPGAPKWGDIVVWTGNAATELYMEFPSDISFYLQIKSDRRDARLLHAAYTQYNKDMRFFVETRGMSPDNARSEIRRINEEVFKLILEGAVAILTSGAGISQVNNAMRFNSERLTTAAQRSPRVLANAERIRPVGGRVNVGGGFETPHYTNLNPLRGNSGGPVSGIPNFVKGGMEEMDQIFQTGSVEEMISNKLRFVDVNWTTATSAAAKVMRPGGRVSMNVWCNDAERTALKAAFERAGFKNVTVSGNGPGTMLEAVR